MERANRDIKTIFRLSFDSRNFERMRNRIMYVINIDAPILYRKNLILINAIIHHVENIKSNKFGLQQKKGVSIS